jgi:hypothetical protein
MEMLRRIQNQLPQIPSQMQILQLEQLSKVGLVKVNLGPDGQKIMVNNQMQTELYLLMKIEEKRRTIISLKNYKLKIFNKIMVRHLQKHLRL